MSSRDGKTRPGLLFPGQGAQTVGMGHAAYRASLAARHVFERADAALEYPISKLCFEGPVEELLQTRRQQPAVVACSLALLAAHDDQAGSSLARAVSGHSLGLYSALVAAGALELEDALGLVALRGELMQRAADERPGGMAAVLGLDDAVVDEVCADASRGDDIVVAANYNAPGQVVISGAMCAVDRAVVMLKARGARKVVALPVAGAFHSPLMGTAAEAMAPALRAASISRPACPVVANTAPVDLCDAESIRTELIDHIAAPVRWTAAVRRIVAVGATPLVDCGPGATLAGLLKRIVPGVPVVRIDGGG